MKTSGAFALGLWLLMPVAAHPQMMSSPPGTVADKIASAMRAGPPQITAHATILDWPAMKGGHPTQLRAGTSEWVCYPRSRKDVDNAMCFDLEFQKWMDAIKTRTAPRISRVGVAYLLSGGFTGSASDPFATGMTPANDWGHDGPSLMIISPDSSLYGNLPRKRSAGPYVMYSGTPYAHIMVPVAAR